MQKKDIVKRWEVSDFVTTVKNQLEEVFVQRKNSSPYDFRGIVIGLSNQVPGLTNPNFQMADLRDIDFSFSKFSCSFIGGNFSDLIFDEAVFDSCLMTKSSYRGCSFQKARITADLEASYLENCNFDNAKFVARGSAEYGGRRINFKSCSFQNTLFNRMEFRASTFIDCVFNKAVFTRCDLRGVKFIGFSPKSEQFSNCLI